MEDQYDSFVKGVWALLTVPFADGLVARGLELCMTLAVLRADLGILTRIDLNKTTTRVSGGEVRLATECASVAKIGGGECRESGLIVALVTHTGQSGLSGVGAMRRLHCRSRTWVMLVVRK
jgi:hypothetical protein